MNGYFISYIQYLCGNSFTEYLPKVNALKYKDAPVSLNNPNAFTGILSSVNPIMRLNYGSYII